MHILLTGADSFAGQNIANGFIKAGHSVRMMGKDREATLRQFPDADFFDYNQLNDAMKNIDYVVHTQAQKFDKTLDVSEFKKINVDLLNNVVIAAREAGVKRFVNVSSVHSLIGDPKNAYVQSRIDGANIVSNIADPNYLTLYTPPMYATSWDGRLAFLNKLPKPFARLIFPLLSALKPTVHIDDVVGALLSGNVSCENQDWIVTKDQDTNMVYKVIKRIIDLTFCFAVIGLLFWALILVWLIIRCTSAGPALFVQDRVGRNGVVFKCWKFRTMHVDTPQTGTHNVTQDATTKIGRILRSTKLDELPQVKNILMNEMSLIGPRPCLPSQKTLIGLRSKQGGLSVKPGISGLGQVKNIDMSTPEILSNIDAQYVKLRGVILDIKLILATASGKGQGDVIKSSDNNNTP